METIVIKFDDIKLAIPLRKGILDDLETFLDILESQVKEMTDDEFITRAPKITKYLCHDASFVARNSGKG